MKVAFVVPRYGPTIIGGAETAARALAEHLVALKGWEVDGPHQLRRGLRHLGRRVPAGEEVDQRRAGDAVHLRRAGRDPSFHPFSASLLADPAGRLAGRRRAVDRPPGPGGARPGRGRPSTRTPTRSIFYPVPLLPDGAGSSTGLGRPPSSTRPPTTSPRSASPSSRRCSRPPTGWSSRPTAERDLVQRTFPVATHRQLLLGLGVDDPGRRPARATRRRPGGSQPATPLPGLPRPGRPAQGDLAAGPSVLGLQGAPPGPAPAGAGRAGGRGARAPPGHRRARARCRTRTSGRCSTGPWRWCPRPRGRRSRWWWPKRGAPAPRWWSTPTAPPPSSTAAGRAAGLPSPASASSRRWSTCSATDESSRTELGERGRAYVDRLVPVATGHRPLRRLRRDGGRRRSGRTGPRRSQIPCPSGRGPAVATTWTPRTPDRRRPARPGSRRWSAAVDTGRAAPWAMREAKPGRAGRRPGRPSPTARPRRCRRGVVEGAVQLVVEEPPRVDQGDPVVGERPAGVAVDVAPPPSTVSNTTTSRPAATEGPRPTSAASMASALRMVGPGVGVRRLVAGCWNQQRSRGGHQCWGRTPLPSRNRWAPRTATTTTPSEVTASQPGRGADRAAPG